MANKHESGDGNNMDKTQIRSANELPSLNIPEVIGTLSENIARDWLQSSETDILVGIHRGGAIIAAEIHQQLQQKHGLQTALGTLDINLYRDDFDQRGFGASSNANQVSYLPAAIDGKRVLMIDDVLYSGRSTRAAVNILFDYGRPLSISLAVLLDRGGRELPIAADFVAIRTELAATQRVKMDLESPYSLSLRNEPAPNRDR
jgi:pyrimidine operon attenuation protein/uracil phosphoribosyltransferase